MFVIYKLETFKTTRPILTSFKDYFYIYQESLKLSLNPVKKYAISYIQSIKGGLPISDQLVHELDIPITIISP